MLSGTEVFVIGGGPAGLAAAIAARQRGLDVIVADGNKPPIDKACGEGLMPESVEALRRLGVELETGDGISFSGIRFVDECTTALASSLGSARCRITSNGVARQNAGEGRCLRRQISMGNASHRIAIRMREACRRQRRYRSLDRWC